MNQNLIKNQDLCRKKVKEIEERYIVFPTLQMKTRIYFLLDPDHVAWIS